jgi:tape measure domain-containing protein
VAAELGAARISVGLDTSKVAGEIRKAFSGVDAAGGEAGKAAGSGFASGFKGIAGPAIAAVGAIGFGGLIAEAARASDATDKFKSTMNFAGLDTSGIEAATAAAKGYADETVYELSDIQKTMATLAANGVDDFTGITKAAGNLNAVAGGNAETFKSVSLALGQSAGAGKLMAEDWNMLADAIPGASGQLQDAMREAGAFEGNFKKAMEAGEISAEEFQAAITKLGNDPIAVEAARSVTTFEGALGNLSATVNSGLMAALDALKPAITGAINLLSNGLGAAFEWVGNAATGLYDVLVKGDFTGALASAFKVEEDSALVDFLLTARDGVLALKAAFMEGDVTSDGFVGVMERIGVGAREVVGGVRAMFAAYKAGDGDITSSGFAGFMERIGLGLREVTGGVRAFFAAFRAGGDDVTSSGFAGFLEGLGLKARALADQIGPVIGGIFAQLGPVLATLGPQFLGLFAAISPVGTIFQAIAPLLPQLLGVFGQLATVVGQTLSTALTTLVPLFVQLQSLFITVFQQVLATALPVIVQLVTMLGATFAQLLPVLMPIIAQVATLAMTLVSQLAPIFMQLISTVLPMVVTAIGAILPAIAPLVAGIAGLLIPIIQALMPVVVTVFGVIADVISSVMRIVMGVIQVVTGIISGNWSQVWEGIQNVFRGIWETILNVVRGVLQTIGQVVISGLGLVANFVGSTLASIGRFFADTWNNVVNGVSGMIGNVVGFFSGLIGKITGAIGNAGSALFSVGKNIVQGLIDGIGSMMGSIGRAVMNIVPEAIRGPFESLLGIHSPSRVFAAYGVNIGQGLINGMDGMHRKIESSVTGLVTVPPVPAFSSGSYSASLAAAGPAFPSRMALMVGGREFEGYLVDTASGVVQSADSQSQFMRRGR